ncbi:hypothetical protein J1N35_032351 [Gossypium stocksii]|uniref:Cation-transporting P-type ATPase C-terminal domain-containing protein n=1 Tax=Gossypium stocksii TaxID=47602 RepID=A0A9D3V496_9ROSI|nr:hypothetical protein J1N35_032351 [Gossypium stocksii]
MASNGDISLEQIKNETVDLERIPVEEVFQQLKCDEVFSGSTCKQGEIEAVVIATGVHTFFGKAAHLVDNTNNVGHFQKARAGITEVHFLPFNPVDKRTAITYIDRNGEWHRCSKGAPEQIIELCELTGGLRQKAHHIIDGFADRGFRSLGVARQCKDEAIATIPVDELIETADGFAGVFPVLTEPGLSVIVSAVLTSRAIFQRMKNYTIYAVSITIRIVMGFMLIALIWEFDFSPFMVLIIAILNDGTIMTISKDRVKPSPTPDSWKLKEIFITGVVLGAYMAIVSVIFFWLVHDTLFFTEKFAVKPINENANELTSALYLQVSIISQALIFVTRSRSWSFVELPGLLLLEAFLAAQLVATCIAVYANWGFARIEGIGWEWAGVIWLFSVITYIPLDILKFIIRYSLTGKAWDNLLQKKAAFTTKKNYGKEAREAQWAANQRTLHGLSPPETGWTNEKDHHELSEIAEQAKKRADIARLRELHTLKGHVESVVKLKGIDIDTIQQHYTV